MKKKQEMDIVFLLDNSGSMHGAESDTIGGYNSYIKSNLENKVKVTTVLFNTKYNMITRREDITKIKHMNEDVYKVGGCTALLDAIGKSIDYMDECSAKKVMFVITTDGLENSSIKYTREDIKKKIEEHKNWQFIYVGSDIDSYQEASSIGIRKSNIANYKKDKRGITNLFDSISKASCMFCEDREIDTSWKKDLEEYIHENEEKI